MIKAFRCKDTAALFAGRPVARWVHVRGVAERKLPNNRLELLKGDRAGRYSIRVNDQWRVCFRFEDGNALDVEIVDYH